MDTEDTLRCHICNSLMYDDGTAEDCTGECGVEIHRVEDKHKPLDFNEDEVVRDLPDFESLFDETDFDDEGC